MKIILYKRDKFFLSRLVATVTSSKYTHSAVLIKHNQLCYFSDSSMTEKGIILTKIHNMPKYLVDREYEIYSINFNPNNELEVFKKASKLTGKEYDTTGAFFWLWHKTLRKLGFRKTNNKYYCFEYTIELLKCYYNIDEKLSIAPNGDTIRKLAKQYGNEVKYLNCGRT